MRKLAAEKGKPDNLPVVISQCSEREKICTHYIPLVKGKKFHVGLPSTEEYQEAIKAEEKPFDLVKTLKNGLRVVFPFLKPYLETTTETPAANNNAEL